MDNIIVTATNSSKSFFYDIEVPTQLKYEKLLDDIVETLNGYNPELYLDAKNISLICSRTNYVLKNEDTLESAGVWNGDYLVIREVRV